MDLDVDNLVVDLDLAVAAATESDLDLDLAANLAEDVLVLNLIVLDFLAIALVPLAPGSKNDLNLIAVIVKSELAAPALAADGSADGSVE